MREQLIVWHRWLPPREEGGAQLERISAWRREVEARFEVPIDAESFRFERPWAWLLLPAALLVLLARGYLHEQRAPRMKLSRVHDLALIGRRGWRTWITSSSTRPGR